MLNNSKEEGLTPSERYLGKLCRKSFLSLWCYSNLYTDKGRKEDKGVGHEMCDLLVVFGDDVIIFSDKNIKFDRSKETSIAWKRWFNKAVRKSVDQLSFAERWLRKYQDRIYLDPMCQTPFPIPMPTPDRIRVHRVAVARGIYYACRDYFGGNSLGSLIVDSDIIGDAHDTMPFTVGHVNPDKGFVHVFEDFTLDAVLKELDTASDFIAYLSKREHFLTREKPKVTAAGDEQLLAIYLTNLDAEGEHDFVAPGEGQPDSVDFDESFWEGMVNNPRYIAKKKADEISYAWDRLIEHFIKYGRGFVFYGEDPVKDSDLEQALRHMASEPRIRRRQLGNGLVEFLKNTLQGRRDTRLVCSNAFPEKAYIFLLLPVLDEQDYKRYREERRAILSAYCKVAKLLCPEASYIIGFATETGMNGASEDLIALDVRDWTSERQEEAESLQKDASLFLQENLKITERGTKEWPDVADETVVKSSGGGFNRKQRRALEKKHRCQKKK